MILRFYIYSIIILLIFLYKYFPMELNKNREPIYPPILIYDNKMIKPEDIYTPSVQKLILVVIDALREDFIRKECMPFLERYIAEKGCLLSTIAKPPTVTMPRVKALTTGTIPQFADLVLNFASSESNTDNILKRFIEGGKKIVFYGDDTWLKLYPKMFLRSEGTTSFFVTDFTEVDNNVTRHLSKEMKRNDWDVMILHYLGLDHIGHMYGPKSPLITQKLLEMDKIINGLFMNASKSTMFLITGDHGMRDGGGHGSTTTPEIQVPTAVLGLQCSSATVAQVDLAPTLSVLFGFPIPSNSIGRVLSNLIHIMPLRRRIYALNYNFNMLSKRSSVCDNKKENINLLLNDYFKNGNTASAQILESLYDYCTLEISNELAKGVQANVSGVICLALLCFFVAITADFLNSPNSDQKLLILVEIILMLSITFSEFVVPRLIAFYCCMFLLKVHFSNIFKLGTLSKDVLFLFGIALQHNFLLNSTSFIEEEHQIYYHAWGTFCLVQIMRQLHKGEFIDFVNWIATFVGLRIFKHWNRVGDKWATMPDITDWLQKSENHLWFNIVFVFGLICLWYYCFKLSNKRLLCSSLSALLMLAIYCYHFVVQSALVGKIMWLIVLAMVAARGSALIVWLLMCAVVLRSYNIILLPVCLFVGSNLYKYTSTLQCIWLHYCLGYTLFFCQGNGNNFAHADVATGYVGLKEYNLVLVTLQVLINSYAFPIASILMINHYMPKERDLICKCFAFCRLSTMVTVCFISYFHQNHLFIWSVFAPKLIIESVHCTILFIPLLIMYICDMKKRS